MNLKRKRASTSRGRVEGEADTLLSGEPNVALEPRPLGS